MGKIGGKQEFLGSRNFACASPHLEIVLGVASGDKIVNLLPLAPILRALVVHIPTQGSPQCTIRHEHTAMHNLQAIRVGVKISPKKTYMPKYNNLVRSRSEDKQHTGCSHRPPLFVHWP